MPTDWPAVDSFPRPGPNDKTNLISLSGLLEDHSDAVEALQASVRVVINVRDYGAVGDGATNDTAAITAAIAAAEDDDGAELYFPPGSYLHTGLTVSKMLTIRGAGANHTSLVLDDGVANTVDNLTIVAGTGGTQNRFLTIRDLAIRPQNAANGRHGIALDLNADGRFLANITIENCWITGTDNGRAICTLPDATPTVTSMFDCRIVGCLLVGGVFLDRVADSIWWQHNLSAGANAGLEIACVSGAAGCVVRDSTFVNDGGGIWVKTYSIRLSILNNYFEKLSAWAGGSGNNALVDLDGTSGGDIADCLIWGNQFSLLTGYAGSCVRVENATGTVIDANTFAPADGGTYGVNLTTGASGTKFGARNRFQSGSGALITNSADASLQFDVSVFEATTGATGQAGNIYLLGMIRAGQLSLSTGSNIASASTVAPSNGSFNDGAGGNIFHVTGTTTINTITARRTGDWVTLIADGAWAFGSSGNIKADTTTMTVDRAVTLYYDGTNWYEVWRSPSRIGARNLLVNGDMRVNQRVTAMPTADDAYCLDQWNLLLEAANAATVAQSGADVPSGGSTQALVLTVGSGEDNKFGVVNFLESINAIPLRGKKVSLQAKIKVTTAITDVRMAVLEWTSTADSITSDVVGTWGSAGTNPTLAANWAYLGTPANLSPTTSWATYKVENLTVGASANNLAVLIWCEDETTTVTTDILRITDVQLEEGPVCSEFSRRLFAEELALCQRYYYKTFPLATAPAQNSGALTGFLHYVSSLGASASQGATLFYPVRMRATPTVTYYNPSASNANWRNLTSAADSGAAATLRNGESAVSVLNPQTGSDAAQREMAVHLTASAEL